MRCAVSSQTALTRHTQRSTHIFCGYSFKETIEVFYLSYLNCRSKRANKEEGPWCSM